MVFVTFWGKRSQKGHILANVAQSWCDLCDLVTSGFLKMKNQNRKKKGHKGYKGHIVAV